MNPTSPSVIHTTLSDGNNTSPNNNTRNSSIALFSTESYIILAFNYPFLLLFVALLLITFVSYMIQRSHMKRNQHVLFSLLFVLEGFVCANILTRTSSEYGILHPDPEVGIEIKAVIKIFDRCLANSAMLMEILIMCHISYVFCRTCRSVGTLSAVNFKRMRRFFIIFILVFTILFVVLNLLVFTVGIAIAADAHYVNVILPATVALVTVMTFLFFVSSIVVVVAINIIGRKLQHYLVESQNRIIMSLKDESTLQSKNTNIESVQTYMIKKSALRKSMLIQYGLSASLLVQCIGFLFIPAQIFKTILASVFHFIFNLGIFIFIVLILCIYNPLKQVTKSFSEGGDFSQSSGANGPTELPTKRPTTTALDRVERCNSFISSPDSKEFNQEQEIQVVTTSTCSGLVSEGSDVPTPIKCELIQ